MIILTEGKLTYKLRFPFNEFVDKKILMIQATLKYFLTDRVSTHLSGLMRIAVANIKVMISPSKQRLPKS